MMFGCHVLHETVVSRERQVFASFTVALLIFLSPATGLAAAVSGAATVGLTGTGGQAATYGLFSFSEVTANARDPKKVIAHPTPARASPDCLADSTNRTVSRTDAPFSPSRC